MARIGRAHPVTPFIFPFPITLQPHFQMAASANIAVSGENTTFQLTAPAGKTTGDFDAGRIQDDENPADAVDITLDDYTEMEWCIEATIYALDVQYDFRVTKNGTVIDTFTVTPQLTIPEAAAAPGQPTTIRTWGVPTGAGRKNRAGGVHGGLMGSVRQALTREKQKVYS